MKQVQYTGFFPSSCSNSKDCRKDSLGNLHLHLERKVHKSHFQLLSIVTGCSDCTEDTMGKKKGQPSVHFVWIKFKQKALTNNCAGMNTFVATLRLKFKFTAGLYAVIVEVLSEDFRL